jgi:uncharacterized protein (DUF885 family)
MMKYVLIALLFGFVECVSSPPKPAEAFFEDFKKGYSELRIPNLSIAYADNLRSIKSRGEIDRQIKFFRRIQKRIPRIKSQKLSAGQKLDLDLIDYETRLNLRRLELEQAFVQKRPADFPAESIVRVPNGKEWYVYFLKRWVEQSVTPDEIFNFGLTEIKKVQEEIAKIRKQTGKSEGDFYKDLESRNFFYQRSGEVQKAFEEADRRISKSIADKFPHLDKVAKIKITPGTNPALGQVPGYYNNQTFYYNFFNRPFKKRQIEWIYIHEAVPGHHYQRALENSLPQSEINQIFRDIGFIEGWGAYVEDIGWEYDAYSDIYSELGKWEWDLVRSVRVSLDVGLNYYGWSEEKALRFWKKHIPRQDEIAMREIKRMKRWPAQVVTYKYGANRFLELKERTERKEGENFDLKDFHRRVLARGSLPFSILEKHL